MRTRVKICGITRPEDAAAAAAAGADAIGLVFCDDSPRALDLDRAKAVVSALPPFVSRVALFLNPAAATVQTVIDRLSPDLLQFHGNEQPRFCDAFRVPYLKAVPMGEDADPREWAGHYENAAGLLLDSHASGEPGGRGKRFEWRRVDERVTLPIVLAGGLNADNVGDAIRNMRPYAVDVSSGVESAPGIKDSDLMQAFIEAVYRVDRT